MSEQDSISKKQREIEDLVYKIIIGRPAEDVFEAIRRALMVLHERIKRLEGNN